MELITNFSYLLFTGMRMRNNLQWKSDNVGILFGDDNPSQKIINHILMENINPDDILNSYRHNTGTLPVLYM